MNIFRTPSRQAIANLDDLPFPNRSLIDINTYNELTGNALVTNNISIIASRGCPYHCAYCHDIWPKKQSFRSAQNIFDEVKYYYELGYRRFSFLDDIFNLNKKISLEFFNLIIKNNLKPVLFFPNGLRGDILTKEYIDILIEAGTIYIAFALESASQRIQKLIQKNIKLEILTDNIDYLIKKHPHVIFNLFTMIGFPTETKEDVDLTLNYIKSIKWCDFITPSILTIFPGSRMERLAVESGIPSEVIHSSAAYAFHDIPDTLPYEKEVAFNFKMEVLQNYFLVKERLLYVLPRQIRLYTEHEFLNRYNSYLNTNYDNIDDLYKTLGISRDELGAIDFNKNVSVEDNSGATLKIIPEKSGNSKLRILLIDVSQSFESKSDRLKLLVEQPLGLLYILSYLYKEMGDKIEGRIIKPSIDYNNYYELIKIIKQFDPQIIGCRGLTFYNTFFHQTIKTIRDFGINVPIIAGGPYATANYSDMLLDKNIDIVVIGEGELTFKNLVEEIINNNNTLPDIETLKKINGIAFNLDNSTISVLR